MIKPRRLSDSSVSSACSADSTTDSCLTNVILQQKRSQQTVILFKIFSKMSA